jgi:DNA replication protein DnaC
MSGAQNITGVGAMINEETRRKLREMNIEEMITALDIQEQDPNYVALAFDKRLQMAVDYLYQEKYNGRIQRLIKQSKFRIPNADMTSVIYKERGIDQNAILELSTCQFISSSSHVILQGFTGSGKTFLACALGKQACKQRIRTRYVRLPDILMEHDEARLVPKAKTRLLKKYCGYGLLVIDEWLLEDISDEEQHFLFELIERRHDAASTIFCTQYRKVDWHTRLGGGIHADAIMDRIVHNAVWIETGEINMREYCAKHKI